MNKPWEERWIGNELLLPVVVFQVLHDLVFHGQGDVGRVPHEEMNIRGDAANKPLVEVNVIDQLDCPSPARIIGTHGQF